MTSKNLMDLEQLFAKLLEDGDQEELFESRNRDGIFSPALVMWLTIASRLEGRASLLGALDKLSGGCAKEIIERNSKARQIETLDISRNSGGLCRARQRLSLNDVEEVCSLVSNEVMRQSKDFRLWNDKRVYLVDGTSMTVAYSEVTHEKYAPVTNPVTGSRSHTSQMVCGCVHDLATGVALCPAVGPYAGEAAIGETTLCKAMLNKLKDPGVVMADRAFGIFAIAWTAAKMSQKVLLRLTSPRAKGLLGRKLGTANIDEKITWAAGNLDNHPEIPSDSQVLGRLIQHSVKRSGYRDLVLTFFTTLDEPVHEILDLYLQRERIENDIRSLKYTLGLEMLHSRTPDVLEKEIMLGYAAYNLLRSTIAKAAQKLKIEPRKISFSRAVAYTQIYGNQLRVVTNRKQRTEIERRFLLSLYQTRHPNRSKRRLEPRKVVRKKYSFPLMKESREKERTKAEQNAQIHGHRGFMSTVSRKY